MSELTKRLREHAALHGDIGKFNDEQAQWERDLLDAADYIDNDEASGVHTCHGHCKRLACVQRREIERLRYAIKMERGKTEKADEDNERLRGLIARMIDADWDDDVWIEAARALSDTQADQPTDAVGKFTADLIAAQRPLDPDVAKVLYENRHELYEDGGPAQPDKSTSALRPGSNPPPTTDAVKPPPPPNPPGAPDDDLRASLHARTIVAEALTLGVGRKTTEGAQPPVFPPNEPAEGA